MITMSCPLCGTEMDTSVHLTSVSPVKGVTVIDCPGCGNKIEIRYDVTKRHPDREGLTA